MAQNDIYKIALDSLSAHVAIVDKDGFILETNRAWREFALANEMKGSPDCIGMNYLRICEDSSEEPGDVSAAIAAGLRKVISGEFQEFFIDYPCHSPTEERWFALRVVPFREKESRKVILTHENITPLIQVQRNLAEKEHELRDKTAGLEESNIALKVLLKQREEDRLQLEENILNNVRTLVLPSVQKLSEIPLAAREKALVEIIAERLHEITSPFLNRLSSLHSLLTPQEIQVATMVKEGKSSGEIADILSLSVSAIDFHRKKIRKKLGMTGKGKNLRSYLMTLQ